MRCATKPFAFVIPLLIVAAQPGLSQSRWSGELTGDAAFATQTLAGADLRTGGGFGVNARYRFQPHLSAYAGWEWHLQQSTELLPEQTLDLNDTGYALGLRFEHPLASGTAVWGRAGGLYNHIEVENEEGKIIHDTGHGLGWEAGTGFTIPLTARLGLTPSVRYRTFSRDVTLAGATRASTLSYVTTGIGIAFTF
jgi:hypothetical protein